MILLIDNYDSFSYNLFQMVGSINNDIKVVRNDKITIQEIRSLNPSHIILSPGPGHPKNAGICEEVIRQLKGEYPILGVCLGHQAVCEVFGAKVTYARKLMHGKQSEVSVDNRCKIFSGLPNKINVARYHSLVGIDIPEELIITSTDSLGEVMAVKHRDYEIYGLQFHPESILTPNGKTMLDNFLRKV